MLWVRAIVDTEPRLGVLADAGHRAIAHPETVLDLGDTRVLAPIENPLRSATGGPVRQPLAVRATRQYNQDS